MRSETKRPSWARPLFGGPPRSTGTSIFSFNAFDCAIVANVRPNLTKQLHVHIDHGVSLVALGPTFVNASTFAAGTPNIEVPVNLSPPKGSGPRSSIFFRPGGPNEKASRKRGSVVGFARTWPNLHRVLWELRKVRSRSLSGARRRGLVPYGLSFSRQSVVPKAVEGCGHQDGAGRDDHSWTPFLTNALDPPRPCSSSPVATS